MIFIFQNSAMGASFSSETDEEAKQMQELITEEEKKEFFRSWPANARFFSGKPLPNEAYVVVLHYQGNIGKPWLAFETRKEADAYLRICNKELQDKRWKQKVPYLYQGWRTNDDSIMPVSASWISVVSRQQIREAGLFCEAGPENNSSAVVQEGYCL
jgi:hypothetical protein